MLAGSVLIDLDHVPRLFGSDVLEHGVPRPYTNALITLPAIAIAAALIRNRAARALVLVVGAAVALHLLPDMAEPGGPGVALLWPVSDRAAAVPYLPYALGSSPSQRSGPCAGALSRRQPPID